MSRKVTVTDFGAGNLLSVVRAMRACGADVHVSNSVGDLLAADRLIVPGVGAFADSMRGLEERGLKEAACRFAEFERPMLGICVGMQMLFDMSEEFGRHAGLGLIPGEVRRIPGAGTDGKPHKVPHIGWNGLRPAGQQGWQDTILKGIPQGASVYFVHSFTGHPVREDSRVADADYNGCRISAVVARGSLSGCQFHPEKSGPTGLAILRNFMAQ